MTDERSTGATLVLEASTAGGSIALLRGDTVWARSDVQMGASALDRLFPAVQSMLEQESPEGELREIVCGAGPGSFTSLRIAAAVSKGLAHATGASLYAVPSLLLAAAGHGQSGRFLVHADALRGERYAMPVVIDGDLIVRAEGAVRRVALDELDAAAEGRVPLSVGPSPLAAHHAVVSADAAMVSRVAGWRTQGPVDLASWEPAYGRLAEAQVKWEVAHARPLALPG